MLPRDHAVGMRRRSVLYALAASGALSSVSACLTTGTEDVPAGDPSERPARQHAWNDLLERDDHGNVRLPERHAFLWLSYVGADRSADRDRMAGALTDLERAYRAGSDGLLFTVGYSPAYFARYDEPLEGVDLPPAGPLHDGEHVATDDADVLVHLASDHLGAVQEAARVLLDGGEANGTAVRSLSDVVTIVRRREGFVGGGLPAENDANLQGLPEGSVHEDAPTFMNFRSGLRRTQAPEDRVTIEEGRFAGGTTQHVELLRLQLQEWFDHPPAQQIAHLFAPDLDVEDVGEYGERLADHNGVEPVDERGLREVVAEHGVVGHAQKLARFREDGRPPILRRDVTSADNGEAGMVFVSLQRDVADFRALRLAMEGLDLAAETAVGERRDNGILQYLRNRHRGNFLIPPRELRALP